MNFNINYNNVIFIECCNLRVGCVESSSWSCKVLIGKRLFSNDKIEDEDI